MPQIFSQSTVLACLIIHIHICMFPTPADWAYWVSYLICIMRLCRRKVAIFKFCEPIMWPVTKVKCKLPWFLVRSCRIWYICTVTLHLDDQHSSTSFLARIVLNVKDPFLTIRVHASDISKKLSCCANYVWQMLENTLPPNMNMYFLLRRLERVFHCCSVCETMGDDKGYLTV